MTEQLTACLGHGAEPGSFCPKSNNCQRHRIVWSGRRPLSEDYPLMGAACCKRDHELFVPVAG